jgi:hypothetical protein
MHLLSPKRSREFPRIVLNALCARHLLAKFGWYIASTLLNVRHCLQQEIFDVHLPGGVRKDGAGVKQRLGVAGWFTRTGALDLGVVPD